MGTRIAQSKVQAGENDIMVPARVASRFNQIFHEERRGKERRGDEMRAAGERQAEKSRETKYWLIRLPFAKLASATFEKSTAHRPTVKLKGTCCSYSYDYEECKN